MSLNLSSDRRNHEFPGYNTNHVQCRCTHNQAVDVAKKLIGKGAVAISYYTAGLLISHCMIPIVGCACITVYILQRVPLKREFRRTHCLFLLKMMLEIVHHIFEYLM
jgi:hypothetical protein